MDGPYSLLLSADAYTAVSETADHGYPIREHLARVVDGEIIWAPAIDGAFVLTARGGDYELRLGQDLSIGYLSHDADHVQLYFQESLTFLVYTTEASVALARGVSVFVPGRREGVLLVDRVQLALFFLAARSRRVLPCRHRSGGCRR